MVLSGHIKMSSCLKAQIILIYTVASKWYCYAVTQKRASDSNIHARTSAGKRSPCPIGSSARLYKPSSATHGKTTHIYQAAGHGPERASSLGIRVHS